MKKYVIYLLLMMFSSMGAQAQKVLFQRGFGEIGKQQGVHHESIRSKK